MGIKHQTKLPIGTVYEFTFTLARTWGVDVNPQVVLFCAVHRIFDARGLIFAIAAFLSVGSDLGKLSLTLLRK